MSNSASQAKAVLRRLDARFRSKLPRIVDAANAVLAARVRIAVPKVSGDLARTLRLEAAKTGETGVAEGFVVIGGRGKLASPHAAAVEFGTKHIRPHPYFRPSARQAVPAMTAVVRLGAKAALL